MATAAAMSLLILAGCADDREDRDGPTVALGGLDPISLIQGREVPGAPNLGVTHENLRYLFSSAMNRALFEENPQRFAIQLGGRCAGSDHDDEPGSPDTYSVHEGRIYIFCDQECRDAFLSDPDRYVAREPGQSLLPAAGAQSIPQSWLDDRSAMTNDWPQWGGPHRNFKSRARGLAGSWPEAGPQRLWSRKLGEGYSAIAVADGALFTMYRRDDREVAVSLDPGTGETLWEYAYPAPVTDQYNMEFGRGPHATPLVIGGVVITVGATGLVHALNAGNGRVLWSHDLIGEFDGTVRGRGYAASPVAYRNTVILPTGGEGASLVAFDRNDGSIVWQAQSYKCSPSSPIIIEVDGEDQLVAFLYDDIVGLDPTNGELLWSHPHRTDWGLNTSTPVWGEDNLLFVSSGYGGGSRLLRLTRLDGRTSAEELWFTRKMRVHFGNAIRLGNFVFASSGDFGPSFFAAIDLTTGELAWAERSVSKASFLFADGRFIILDEDGVLTLATPTAEGLDIHSSVELLSDVTWTVPSLVGTTLFVRDRERILALDLG